MPLFRTVVLLCLVLSCLTVHFVEAVEITSLFFSAPDNIRIHTEYRVADKGPGPRLIIVAPGYAQHSGTQSMQTLAKSLTKTADVMIVDFRGNGRSQGWYRFGSEEYQDLAPVFVWAQKYYNNIIVLGFSLGSYHSIRAVHTYPGVVEQLFLVSCPTRVEDVVLSGGAFLNPLALLFRQTEFQHQPKNDVFFRYGWVFSEKPDASELVQTIDIPMHFLVGGKDTLVFEPLTQKVFLSAAGLRTYKKIGDGVHAEQMFMQHPHQFLKWITTQLD
jgi:pimeloyl-ACP methyl ester carboxylesterase